ncbi:hypothetical protein T484DRAFT_1989998 [Baffinella frigidus]|nr:hypothetical protein T484DRAFT_1989998 [Cryptophyta sp. CCMP2293]
MKFARTIDHPLLPSSAFQNYLRGWAQPKRWSDHQLLSCWLLLRMCSPAFANYHGLQFHSSAH